MRPFEAAQLAYLWAECRVGFFWSAHGLEELPLLRLYLPAYMARGNIRYDVSVVSKLMLVGASHTTTLFYSRIVLNPPRPKCTRSGSARPQVERQDHANPSTCLRSFCHAQGYPWRAKTPGFHSIATTPGRESVWPNKRSNLKNGLVASAARNAVLPQHVGGYSFYQLQQRCWTSCKTVGYSGLH
ncbi:hypothetical protein GY45DRAFT_669334 [Cubamyces sp. BRFM 1775]|nr:hypothetical protein GY45DRAFT_669334 [Cubamyces sp. BRFM 1775]